VAALLKISRRIDVDVQPSQLVMVPRVFKCRPALTTELSPFYFFAFQETVTQGF